MSSGNSNYETLYGVGLLDDLHNHFPALLYDTNRFNSVRDVLMYITQNTRNRFDLFSFGQRNYMQTNLPPAPSHRDMNPNEMPPLIREQNTVRANRDISGAGVHQPRSAFPPVPSPSYADAARRGVPLSQNPLSASVELYTEDLVLDNSALSLMNLVNLISGFPGAGLGRGGGRFANPNMEDVVVSATEQEIEAGSTRSFPEAETVCSICQDNIGTNEMGRKLTHCGHTFHIRCIDTWFSRNVHCPICRHDIREQSEEVN